ATSCWVKTFGGFTLALPEKSLHLVADEELGASEFHYKFFSTKPFNEFEHLVLRTSGSDQNDTRFKDMSLSSLASDLGLDHMAYQPCSFYVNDKYFGIINLREKINFDYLAYNHHANKDSTELIDMHGHHSTDYMHLFSELENTQSEPKYNERMESLMDVENYMNFSILQIYISNSDSRGNIRFWKSKNLDNRWRWIFYDSDLGCRDKYQKINFLQDRISATQTQWYNPPWATHILRNLTTNAETRDRFINQVCLLQATQLNHDTIIHRIEAFTHWLKPEIPFHVHRYPVDDASESQWLKSIQRLKDFFEMRKSTFHDHMCRTFDLDEERVNIRLASNIPSEALLSANHSALRFTRFEGLFYRGRSLSIEAKSRFPYFFDSWKEDGSKQEERNIDLSSHSSWTALFHHALMDTALHQRMGIAAFGTEMKSKEEVHWIALFNTTGKSLNLSDFQLHLFERGEAITFDDNDAWKDSTYIIITTNKKKWKKRHPDFNGHIIEKPWLSQFQQQMT
ncbi:MAG: CotH kinase family protein, partial [Flavobacteriales bacterium]